MTTLGERIRRLPGARRLLASRAVAGAHSRNESGLTVWTTGEAAAGAPKRPLILLLSPEPTTVSWLASVLAVDLDAVVAVAPGGRDVGVALETAIQLPTVDAAKVGVLGDGAAAGDAIELCRSSDAVIRLALVTPAFRTAPAPAPDEDAHVLPPTFIQSSQHSAQAELITSLEVRLRAAGVAVRATEYTSVSDEWTRYPRFAGGASRARTDLVAFFRRGLGTETTFSVIPGWDLS